MTENTATSTEDLAVALREGRVTEAVVRVEDMARVQGWAFVNSLRGWVVAELM